MMFWEVLESSDFLAGSGGCSGLLVLAATLVPSLDSSCCQGLGTLKMLINFYRQDSSWSPLYKNNIITFPHEIKGETLQADRLAEQRGA